ncbi:MAG: hypothetical protein FWG13_06365 [Leptospirales bacterium]|nr:hypothetical protein [Leptospirales bacterium]
MDKKLGLESKKCVVVDIGRSYIDYFNIDELCLKTFPDEALDAMHAFRNIVNADVYDPGKENKGFSNYVGWLEPVKNTVVPDADALAFIEKAAAEIRAKSGALLFVGSDPACLAVKAGIDFFAQGGQPEIILIGESGEASKKALDKIGGRKFSICAVEDKNMPREALAALEDIKGAENFYAFSNNSGSPFCASAKKNGAEVFIYDQQFTGPSLILSPGTLLPLAAAGIDIKAILEGATLEKMEDMETFIPVGCASGGATRELLMPLSTVNIKNYSATRKILKDKGFATELFVYNAPVVEGFIGWLKYISKELAGAALINSDAVNFSAKNGVLENYTPDGKGFFETFVYIGKLDLTGACRVTESMQRQRRTGIPIIRVEIPERTPYFYGQAISLFSKSTAITGVWK